MGLSYKGDCPFCGIKHVALTAVHAWVNKKTEKRALFKCGHCDEGVIREYVIPPRGQTIIDIMQYSGDGTAWNMAVSKQWPLAPSTDAPADCPANVASFFKQAVSVLNGGNYDASGMMFRKTLEAATKALGPNSAGSNLASRIKSLVKSHTITPALGDWANEVRLGGNDAAHDEDPFTKEEAEDLHHFTENFLNYVFTMPAAVARRTSPT